MQKTMSYKVQLRGTCAECLSTPDAHSFLLSAVLDEEEEESLSQKICTLNVKIKVDQEELADFKARQEEG